MRAIVAISVLAVVPLADGRAWAHHDAVASSIDPRSSVAVELAAARFDLDGTSGSWQTMSTSLELDGWRRIALSARIPIAHIAYDDGHDVAGIGDIDVAARLVVATSDRARAAIGFSVELPTGDAGDGLGSGHVEIAPFALASYTIPMRSRDALAIRAALADRLSFGGDAGAPRRLRHGALDGGVHGSPLSPHADHELVGALEARYQRGRASVALASDLVLVWDGEPWGSWSGSSEVAFDVTPRLRASLGAQLPLAGDRRFEWRGRFAIAWLL